MTVQDPGPNNQETIVETNNERTPQSFPQVEVMRDATLDYRLEDVPFWPDQKDDQMEPDEVLMEIMKDKENHIPDIEMVSGGPSFPSPPRQEPFSAATEQGHETFDSHVAFGEFEYLLFQLFFKYLLGRPGSRWCLKFA